MESWRQVWRDGFVPALTTAELTVLRDALRADDPRLIQGSTTTPPPLTAVEDWPVEAACALGFCGWQGDELETVGEVEWFFAQTCYTADTNLGEAAACRWFLNWFDDTPRAQVVPELLAEVDRALAARHADPYDWAAQIRKQLDRCLNDRMQRELSAIAAEEAELHRLADDGCPHVPCHHGSPDATREPIENECQPAPAGCVRGEAEAAADRRAAPALC